MLKKFALTVLVIVIVILLFNFVVTLAPDWKSNVRISLALVEYWVTLGFGSFVA
jgi:hypothetical protein